MRRLAPGLPDGLLTQREEDIDVVRTGLRWSAIWAFAHTADILWWAMIIWIGRHL